jgi:UTP-glucose-1-phosphate uridylyltransferase
MQRFVHGKSLNDLLPMTKTSTIQYIINNLASKSNEEINDTDSVFNVEEEFEDVLDVLNQLECDVRQEVVDKIISMSSQI